MGQISRFAFSAHFSAYESNFQRAENGALDLWSLDLRLGRPRFLPQIAPKPIKTRVLGPLVALD